jgi:OLD-like protein
VFGFHDEDMVGRLDQLTREGLRPVPVEVEPVAAGNVHRLGHRRIADDGGNAGALDVRSRTGELPSGDRGGHRATAGVSGADEQQLHSAPSAQAYEQDRPRAVVLVEGISDQIALETLAARTGRSLEGVAVVPIGGAQAIGRYVARFGAAGIDLAGLCDAQEEREFKRALERAGLGSDLTRADLERLGFYVCVPDLEGELIRALGTAAVEDVAAAQGDLGSFRTLQKQPAWRGRPVEEQLRRFMGSGGRRKIRYAQLLVEKLEPAQVPRPLELVLATVCR